MWVLLLLPFAGLLWVPFYNFHDPALFGFPFFYWYQLAWVPITSILIWMVYRSRTPDDETPLKFCRLAEATSLNKARYDR